MWAVSGGGHRWTQIHSRQEGRHAGGASTTTATGRNATGRQAGRWAGRHAEAGGQAGRGRQAGRQAGSFPAGRQASRF